MTTYTQVGMVGVTWHFEFLGNER